MAALQTLAWDDFRLVKTIAEAKGLAGAAERLSVNHSTVFRRLGQLEGDLGVKLFERHRTGYALTAAGEEMASLAERMEEDVATFARKLAGQAVSPAGGLRATDSPPETLVGRRAATIAWAIYGRGADLPEPGRVDLVDLYERPWVALGDNLAGLKVARFVRERVAAERIVYKVNTVLGLAEAVEAGIGVGPLPCFIADARPALVRLSEPNPDFSTGLWLLTHPDLRHSARVRVFLDFLAAEIAKRRRYLEGGAR